MKNKYYIAYACDDGYAMQTGVSLYSLFDNNKELDLCVYIFSDKISDDNKTKLMHISEKFSKELIIKDMPDLNNFSGEDLYIGGWAISTYCRLFFTELLPSEIEKILWLDGDTLVVSNISEIFSKVTDDYACAAVLDTETHCKRLNGYRKREMYFNAGILLINLRYWRENRVYDRFLSEIKRRKGRSVDVDQSYINCILKGQIKKLPLEYNFFSNLFMAEENYEEFLKKAGYKDYEFYSRDEIDYALTNVKIYHFAGAGLKGFKPWLSDCLHPAKQKWLDCLSMTEWNNYKPIDSSQSYKEIKKSHIIRNIICAISPLRILYVRLKYGYWQKNLVTKETIKYEC